MAVADLYVRSRAKVSVSDLWLHPAGPSGSTPPPITASGTAPIVLDFAGAESLVDAGNYTLVLSPSGDDALAELADLGLTISPDALEALAETGDYELVLVPTGDVGTGLALPASVDLLASGLYRLEFNVRPRH